MSSVFYFPRRVFTKDMVYTEEALLAASNHIVVLAEPGGGKTELMRSLARQLGTSTVTANRFKHMGTEVQNFPLVIDAFDELAKLDQTGIHSLLANASKATPTHVIISSRSSEWDTAATSAFEDYLGCSPLVVRLCEFEEIEQMEIFHHHVSDEDFPKFKGEVARFDLGALLPNPQFLKMFADAYIQSGRRFTDKRNIFFQAVERLAKEANTNMAKTNQTLSVAQKVELSSEVFAKLLLSGAEGIGTSEATADRIYPLLASLFVKHTPVEGILATRLFKPGDSADQHRPVHKIVAEYCAASYLVNRMADPADPLTLHKCLPIVAPSATVRDELRGLLGWLAALGNKSIQEAAIKLDPYAVLANGDPSQLEQSSKRLLIQCLKEVETKDPYFRRGDSWRRFSAAGFFTQDVLEEIKPLLSCGSDGHLRDLILELLAGSPAIAHLTNELRKIVLSPIESEHTRLLAGKCLLDLKSYNHDADLEILVSEASNASLKVAIEIIMELGPEIFGHVYLSGFFRTCSKLYPIRVDYSERTVGSRYFLRRFVRVLDLKLTESLLDELSGSLVCRCEKDYYQCGCRVGISKVIGLLLDRYFELAASPFDSWRVWQWLENLNFHDQQVSSQSISVLVLQSDDKLRQNIIAHAFGKLSDQDEIFKTRVEKFEIHSHSGLHLQSSDYTFLVGLAFETDNLELWASFFAVHNRYQNKKERGTNLLRRHMREQALKKKTFMCQWAKSNRAYARLARRTGAPRFGRSRRIKRRQQKQNNIRAKNITFFQDNRELVESGSHWSSLVLFAELVLMNPGKIEQRVGDETLVRNALKNCFGLIDSNIPDLDKLAELKCSGKTLYSEMVLLAACLEVMRVDGNLANVDHRLLSALRTNIDMGYSGVSEEERDALKAEVDRLVFFNISSAERFLREYVEPQLACGGFQYPDIWLLRGDEAFSQLRAAISIEWLERFPELALEPLDSLFEIAAEFGDRNILCRIITERCANFMSVWPSPTSDEKIEQKRIFWFVRAFYFLEDTPATYWSWLQSDKEVIFSLSTRSGRFDYGEHFYWPKLTVGKVEAVLTAFIGEWPRVELPGHWGTESPKDEQAYRFLTEIVWSINSDDSDEAILVLSRLLADPRFNDMYNDLRSMLAGKIRQKALRDFEPPTPLEIVNRLDCNAVVNVEGLRQLVIQELQDFQKAIDGGEFNSADRFYDNEKHLKEVPATEIIAERLNLRLEPQGIAITPEHQLKSAKRSDFTATKLIGGIRRLLVTEVKGQWHPELYTAAAAQLYERYSIHPDAERQGIYLVMWFGRNEKVAGLKKHGINTASELKKSIEKELPLELAGLIDVFVLDVSKA
ncbi:NACHT domain-containing protein [Pseudomonas antarctica]|uniref:NACHT domain-containing protein n=1 Tax=Pseudomonas antarctica TaxID=219572 RepID=UPI0039C1CC1A